MTDKHFEGFKIIFIPAYLKDHFKNNQEKFDTLALFNSLESNDFNLFLHANVKLKTMLSGEGKPLFEGFSFPIAEDSFIWENHKGTYEDWLKAFPFNHKEDTDLMEKFRFSILALGLIDVEAIHYDHYKREIHLYEDEHHHVWYLGDKDAESEYDYFISKLLHVLGKYNDYNTLASLPIFREYLEPTFHKASYLEERLQGLTDQ